MISLPEPLQIQLKACRTLPSVPAVALQVLDLCQDDSVSIGKVAKTLVRDPALSGKVLKVANSPIYGVRSQVTTLERAITILGVNATLSLALSFSLVRGLQKTKGKRFDHQAYWRRCVIGAAASRAVGAWANYSSHDELFLGGLLQDIGMLVLNEAMPERYGQLVASAKGDHAALIELEQREFAADHAAVGAWILERWNLPSNLWLATASSHCTPGEAGDLPIFNKCVALANDIAAIWAEPNTAAAAGRACERAIAFFNTSSSQLDRILGEIALSLPTVTANLDIDIGGEEFVDRMLDEARGALIELSLQAQRSAREIRLRAQRDDLTSLSNRAYLNEILPQQYTSAQQLGQPLSMLFIDIDNIGAINDSYGHHGGDCVLVSVAQVLRLCTREFDTVARYGGDEFIIVLSNIGEKVVVDISNRILAAVRTQSHAIAGGLEIPVTISIGCVTMSAAHNFSSVNDLLDAADRCLLAAKSGGRNRVVTFDELGEGEASARPTRLHL